MRRTLKSEKGSSLVETAILLTFILLSSGAISHFSGTLNRKFSIASCKINSLTTCDGGGTIGIEGPTIEVDSTIASGAE